MINNKSKSTSSNHKREMPRENAPMIIKYFIEYALEQHNLSERKLEQAFENTMQEVEANSVFDEEAHEIKTISLEDLKNSRYYTSNAFSIKFYKNLDLQLEDEENLGYNVGKIILENEVPLFKRIASKFLAPELIFEKFLEKLDDDIVESEVKRWGNTKTISAQKVSNNRYDFVIKHDPGIIVSKIALELHRGIFESYFLIMGYKSLVKYKKIHKTREYYRFIVQYSPDSLIRKLIVKLPFIYNTGLQTQNIKLLENNFHLNRKIKILEEKLYQTKLKNFSQNLELGNTKLKNSIKSDWLSKEIRSLTHEINNEIYFIKDYASSLDEENIPEGLKKNFDSAVDNIFQSNSKINKIFKEGLKREYKEINLKKLIEQIINEYRFKYMLYDFKSIVHCEDGVTINGVKQDLYYNFKNIINNSIQSMKHKEKRVLKIKAENNADNGKVKIIIQDNGSGIKDEHLNKVTKAGFTTKENGTGEGLWLLKSFVDNIPDANLNIESKYGEGTVVSLILPDKLN